MCEGGLEEAGKNEGMVIYPRSMRGSVRALSIVLLPFSAKEQFLSMYGPSYVLHMRHVVPSMFVPVGKS
jgi:hypothetical protein